MLKKYDNVYLVDDEGYDNVTDIKKEIIDLTFRNKQLLFDLFEEVNELLKPYKEEVLVLTKNEENVILYYDFFKSGDIEYYDGDYWERFDDNINNVYTPSNTTKKIIIGTPSSEYDVTILGNLYHINWDHIEDEDYDYVNKILDSGDLEYVYYDAMDNFDYIQALDKEFVKYNGNIELIDEYYFIIEPNLSIFRNNVDRFYVENVKKCDILETIELDRLQEDAYEITSSLTEDDIMNIKSVIAEGKLQARYKDEDYIDYILECCDNNLEMLVDNFVHVTDTLNGVVLKQFDGDIDECYVTFDTAYDLKADYIRIK